MQSKDQFDFLAGYYSVDRCLTIERMLQEMMREIESDEAYHRISKLTDEDLKELSENNESI